MASASDINWRKENKNISSRLKTILQRQLFTDVAIHVQGTEFKCHRLILALGSPVFEQMFYHIFAPSPIIENNVTPEAFHRVLSFMYTDKVTFANEAEAFQTYEVAYRLQMDDLKSECETYLSIQDFRPKSIWNNLAAAISLKMDQMRRNYMNYILKYPSICLPEDSFLAASDEIVMAIITSDKLNMQEIELLNRLVAWGEYRHLQYVHMRLFLCHIRFKALSAKEFCKFTTDHPYLIEPSESLAILKYLELPDKNTLPSWCSALSIRALFR